MMMYENPTNFQCNYLHYSIITSYPYDCGEIASERPCWFPIFPDFLFFPVNSCQTNPPCSNDSHHCHYFSTGTSINFIYHHGFLVYNLRIDKGDTYLFSTHLYNLFPFSFGFAKRWCSQGKIQWPVIFFPKKQLAISSHPQSLWHATITLLLAISISIYLFVRLSVHPSIHLSASVSINPFINRSNYVSSF